MVYIFGSWISNFAKPTFNWLETKPRIVSCSRIHVTNFKTLSPVKALYEALHEALHEALLEALHKALLEALLEALYGALKLY